MAYFNIFWCNIMSGYILIRTTHETHEEATKMARLLVESVLCKCAHIAKIESLYTWDGKFCHENEFSLSVKASETSFGEIAKIIKENHKYEVPEIIATPISAISVDYLAWLEE